MIPISRNGCVLLFGAACGRAIHIKSVRYLKQAQRADERSCVTRIFPPHTNENALWSAGVSKEQFLQSTADKFGQTIAEGLSGEFFTLSSLCVSLHLSRTLSRVFWL